MGSVRRALPGWVVLASVLAGCTPGAPRPAPAERQAAPFLHTALDAVLAQHVDGQGRVDYAGLVRDPGLLESYLDAVAATSPDSDPDRFPDAGSRLAYWINAYNAWVLKIVKDHYPVAGVADVPGPALLFFLPGKVRFFLLQRITLGGETTSLYVLENQVVRRRFRDPRIHFALNCAARGCPRLPQHAFHGERLDAELEAEARRFVAEPRNVRIDDDGGTIRLSSIFRWYEEDFTEGLEGGAGEADGALVEVVARWSEPARAAALRARRTTHPVSFVPYDWALNDQATAPR